MFFPLYLFRKLKLNYFFSCSTILFTHLFERKDSNSKSEAGKGTGAAQFCYIFLSPEELKTFSKEINSE